ncbi:MAG: hypothetical protein ACRDSE_12290, partial [Pseudonocardiaceae bacterium]
LGSGSRRFPKVGHGLPHLGPAPREAIALVPPSRHLGLHSRMVTAGSIRALSERAGRPRWIVLAPDPQLPLQARVGGSPFTEQDERFPPFGPATGDRRTGSSAACSS